VANGVSITFFQSNGEGTDIFIDSVEYLASQTPLPTVMTTSYSFNEDVVSLALAQKLCNAYAALGAQGVSLMFSSGDFGVAAHTKGTCTDFHATFPSSCP
jgi:tripeptidyl-peptidase-1